MTRYSELYYRERGEREKCRRELTEANRLLEQYREFLRANGLVREMTEHVLIKHVGMEAAKDLMSRPVTQND